jgi:predicted phosphodiesterase
MRVAVLADIHGNLPALDAALADIDAAGADRIVLNGDIATGPMPAETLDRLAGLGDRAVWVRGNADRELVAAYDGEPLGDDLPPEAAGPTRYAAARLARHHRDLLAGLPLTVTLEVDGLGPTLFCHATARNDTEIVLVDSPVDSFRQAFSGVTAATVVLGHTHMPFDRLADRRRYVNPGSLGMPYGLPGAHRLPGHRGVRGGERPYRAVRRGGPRRLHAARRRTRSVDSRVWPAPTSRWPRCSPSMPSCSP